MSAPVPATSSSTPIARLVAGALLAAAVLGCSGRREAAPDSAAAMSRGDSTPTLAMQARQDSAPPGTPVIAIVRAADWIGSEWSEDAIRVGLQEEGLERGRDYVFRTSSAGGDLATIPSLLDAAQDAKARVIVTLQDPTLKAAVQRVKGTPIVFHILSDPFAAGAGKNDRDHLPNVTGVYSPGFGDPEQQKRIELIRKFVPGVQRIAVLYSPDEPYAVAMKDKMIAAGQRAKITVTGIPVASVGEGSQAATRAVDAKAQAIEIFGNTAHAAFPAIIAGANRGNIPVFSPSPFEMLKGARAAIYPDFAEGGVVAGHMIAQIMKGKSPGAIPFHQLKTTKTDSASAVAAGPTVAQPGRGPTGAATKP